MSTNTTKKYSDLKKIGVVLFVALLIVVALFATGCSTPAASAPDPEASQASAPEQEPVVEDDGLYAFGETVTYEDGVSVSVSEPADYVAGELASGPVAGQPTLAFKIVVTNGSEEPFDPSLVLATLASGGAESAGVFDTENEVGFPPMTKVLPGQTVEWIQAWSVVDAASLTLELNVGFTHDAAIFTNVQ